MDFIIPLLKVVLVIVSILIVLLVLMQRPKQEGLGAAFAQGMMNEIGGAQTANILQKGTTYLGMMFFGISMLLSVLISYDARADRALGEAAAERIGDKSVGTAGEPTLPLDLGSIPGVDTPLGVTPEGDAAPEGETPEGDVAPEIETPEGEVAPEIETPEGDAASEIETPEGDAEVEGVGAGAAGEGVEVEEVKEPE